MDIANLAKQNPWWRGKEKIEEDYDIQKWNSAKRKWIPKFLDKIEIKPFALHILLGPRQAGKTTAAKLLIKKLLSEKPEQSLFYFNCEELAGYKELGDVLEAYLSFKEANEIKTSIIILDEITSPREWYRAVKFLIDSGRLRNDVLLLTGSTSMAVKREVELFPGRRGRGKDFILFPLSFRDFIEVVNPQLHSKISAIKNLEDIERVGLKNSIFIKELNAEFSKYMKFGGFPLSIKSLDSNKEDVKQVYLSWIKNAILKAGRSDLIAKQILKSVLEKMPSDMSWEAISKEIEIKSPKTVSAYIDLLKSMYAVFILYNIDVSGRKIKFGKNKKIHASDPLLLEIFEDWCGSAVKNRDSVLAESIAADHLSRMFPEKTFFWRNGSEIDVIVMEKKRLYGFEVKWGEKSSTKAPQQVNPFILLTKDGFSKTPLKIPLAVFLASVEIN